MKPNLTDPGKVVITIATTGGLHGKEANPALPEQPHEIVSDFHDCYNAGAAVAHMHVRDPDGRTCSDLGIYHEVVDGVMDRCPGMITQVGNGIGIWFDDAGVGQPFTEEVRMALLDIAPHPDMLTVNAGTFHFDHKGQEWLFANSKQWNSEFIEGCNYRGITNEIEVYDLSHIANVLELAEKGVLKAPMHSSFVMGIRGGIPATPANLLAMLDATPEARVGRSSASAGTNCRSAPWRWPWAAISASAWRTTSSTGAASWPRATPNWWNAPYASCASWGARWRHPRKPAKCCTCRPRRRRGPRTDRAPAARVSAMADPLFDVSGRAVLVAGGAPWPWRGAGGGLARRSATILVGDPRRRGGGADGGGAARRRSPRMCPRRAR